MKTQKRFRFAISIHALREEGDLRRFRSRSSSLHISIHALREEGDNFPQACRYHHHISIHALREEGDDTGHAIKYQI